MFGKHCWKEDSEDDYVEQKIGIKPPLWPLGLQGEFIIYLLLDIINPLTPVPAVTGRAKTHPQFPVLAITGCQKACENNCLSYPP